MNSSNNETDPTHYTKNLEEEKHRRYCITKGRKFKTEGNIGTAANNKIFNAMMFFETGTEITVNKIGINDCFPDLFEGQVTGSELTIIVSFKEVKPINTRSIMGLDC